MDTEEAYADLGLAPGASEAEVKLAWRRLAAKWHPDRNASAAAISTMQRINQAFERIRQSGFAADAEPASSDADAPQATSDAHRSGAGDESTHTEPHHDGSPGDFDAAGDEATRDSTDNRADDHTNGRKNDRTISRKVKLTLEEAAAGCVKVLRGKLNDRCTSCAGAGYRVLGGDCPECNGAGTVRQRAWYGWFGLPGTCSACAGDGIARQSCEPCEGSGKLPERAYRINVRIPHGVRDGDWLHIGERRVHSSHPPLRFDLRVELQPHPLFKLDADGTVICDMPVDAFVWIANRSIEVPTLTGPHRLQLSRQTLSYKLRGLGYPSERRGPRGDHVVNIRPVFPERLHTDQEILLDQLAAAASGPGAPPLAPPLADWNSAVREWERTRTRRDRQAER